MMADGLLRHPPTSECIMLCGKDQILRRLSYGHVYLLSEQIVNFLSKIIEKKSCIGLLMTHNIYLPSIIISCISENYVFIFLNTDHKLTEETAMFLGIKFILTINSPCMLNSFDMCDKLTMDGQDELFLYVKRSQAMPHSFDNVFCVFLTSGTTGKNKIVQVQKYCIENNVECLREKLDVKPSDIIYFGTELTFDPSLIELLLGLTTGCCLLIVPPSIRLNPVALYKTLFPPSNSEYKGVSVLQIVPSLFRRWTIEQQKSILLSDSLRVLAFGGEMFPVELLHYQFSGHLKLFNLYGITEVSCWSTLSDVEKNSTEVSLGLPLSDTTIEVRNEFGEQISSGEGEIYIGSSVRKCIVDNEVLEEGPLFRATGDIAKVDKERLFHLGRKNNIIKRFGNRINLSKIESVISKETNLVNKCVWYKDMNKLVTFILLVDDDRTRKRKILDRLRVKLLHTLQNEEYPDSIELLAKFPLTSHGKIDTRALQSVYLMNKGIRPEKASDLFISLCKVYLGLNESQIRFYQDYTFFEAGGNSITAIQILEEMKMIDPIDKLTNAMFQDSLGCCLSILKDESVKSWSKEVVGTSAQSNLLHNTPQPPDSKKKKYEKSMTIKWKYNLGACVDCSPVVFLYRNSPYVAVGSFSNIFTINNALTGEEISKFTLPKSIESACLPSINSSTLYVGCLDGNMYCLDYIESAVKWKFSTADQIKCQPCYLKDDESVIVFGSYDKHIYSLNTQNGKRIWATYVSESVASTPVLDKEQNRIYVVSILGTCFCIETRGGDILWKHEGKRPTLTSPKLSMSDSSVIFAEAEGRIVCLRRDGMLKWNFQTDGHIFSSPVINNKLIIFGCNDGCLYILMENVDRPELLHKICLGSAIIATPYVCKLWNTSIITAASQDGVLSMVDAGNGDLTAEYKLDSDIFSSPFVYEYLVYVGCRDNYLYCIEVE